MFEDIGATFHLAESYFLLGLVYQKMNSFNKSQEYLQAAVQLFEEMEAPKQVEKVRKAMECKEQ